MRNKTLAAIFALFLGNFGIHRFYLGQVGLGIFYLIFFWTTIPFFLGIIDALVFFGMSKEEFDFRYNKSKYHNTVYPDQRERRSRAPQRNVPPVQKQTEIDQQSRRSRTTVQPTRRSVPANRSTTRASNSEFKKSGIKKFKEFDYDGAIEDFNKALQINNRDIAIHFNLACAYSLTEQKKKAFIHIHQAVVLGFNDFERIHTHESLAFLRIQPEYLAFKETDYKVLPESLIREEDQDELEEAPSTPNGTTDQQKTEAPMLNPAPDNNLLEEIERLDTLRDLGVLNDEEYLEQKAKLENLR